MFKNKFVLIGLVVVLLLATAGGTWFFLKGSEPAADAAESKAAAEVLPKPQIMSLDPSFVVNLLNERGTRFLQVDIEVMSREDGVISQVDDYQVMIRHELIMMFSSLTKDQINSIEGRQLIQQRVVDTINAVLEKETGKKGGVEEVYFTKFVMQ
ncbi:MULTISPECIES: flagellar basal body-associated FliL family protein [Spongiibacter]|uniref:flagellar basal body-associated FliL family protein n=1 Tax=Spongiibacter TaxID=630749 RepID=UPI0004B8390F|nr:MULTISPECIES: flagellar basal body-associated FliL family protein [Spongiibacter]